MSDVPRVLSNVNGERPRKPPSSSEDEVPSAVAGNRLFSLEIGSPAVIQQLRPADGGSAAWRILIAAFIFKALLWGFPISFGVFQDYYNSLPQFANNPNVPLVGTISQGICYLGAPLSTALTKSFPRYRRQQLWLGWPLCILGLVAGFFTTILPGLILTQGLLYGCGFIILTYPILSMLDDWWIARKGMAFGAISAASGASDVVLPFIFNALLTRYGYQTTLRAIAVAMTLLTGRFLPFFQGRLPPAQRSALARTNWSFLRKPLFWVHCGSTLFQGLGLFYPALFLPSYARALGFAGSQGALLLAIMTFTQLSGQFAFGFLSDKLSSVNLLVIACSVVASATTFGLWGTAHSLGKLAGFSILFGFFGYGFGTFRVAMGRAVSDDPSAAVTTYSIFVFLQGVGNILAGPNSASLLESRLERGEYGLLRYRSLILFTGACVGMSAVIPGVWMLRRVLGLAGR